MAFKVSSFHVYSHDLSAHAIENCKVCDTALENDRVAVLIPETAYIQEPVIIPSVNKAKFNSGIHFIPVEKTLRVFGRPPPTLA